MFEPDHMLDKHVYIVHNAHMISSYSDDDEPEELLTTLREQALDGIKQKILQSQPGEFVSENALARSLKISRTPIREALHQLASQGLVRRVPHVGSFVTPLTRRIVREIMEVREALEGRAAGLAAGKMSSEERELLAKRLADSLLQDAESLSQAMEDAGQAVHAAVLRLANNRRIAKAIEDIRDQIHRVQAFAIGVPGRMGQSHREHEAILDAVFAGDSWRAERAMRDHLEGTKKTLLDCLERQEKERGPETQGYSTARS